MSKALRKFKRFDVAHCLEIGGQASHAPEEMRLVSLSQGGCGFISKGLMPDYCPPREIICGFYRNESGARFEDSQVVTGHLIYILPINRENGMVDYFYGVKFLEEDREKLNGIVAKLEKLEAQGRVQSL